MSDQFAGHVVDNNGQPVSNVQVFLKGRAVAKSGMDGAFEFPVTKAEPRFGLAFFAAGYVTITKLINTQVAANENVIVIWPVRTKSSHISTVRSIMV